jgi:hypothetical protein
VHEVRLTVPHIYGDPLKWWLQVGQQRYPLLFKIALDLLSISQLPHVNVSGDLVRLGGLFPWIATFSRLPQLKRYSYSETGYQTEPLNRI